MAGKIARFGRVTCPKGFTAENLRCHWTANVHNLSSCPIMLIKRFQQAGSKLL